MFLIIFLHVYVFFIFVFCKILESDKTTDDAGSTCVSLRRKEVQRLIFVSNLIKLKEKCIRKQKKIQQKI